MRETRRRLQVFECKSQAQSKVMVLRGEGTGSLLILELAE